MRSSLRVGLGIGPKYLSISSSAFGLVELAGHDQHRVVGLVELDVKLPSAARSAPVRCRCGCRSSPCRSCAIRRPWPAAAGRAASPALFSPRSNSLRTTVISEIRSSRLTLLLISRSASSARPNSQIVVGGRHRLVIVGAIDPGGAVVLGPALLQGFGNLGVGRRSLEQHVLQQVGHAGFAVALVPRADEDRQIDRDGRFGVVGANEHLQPVVQAILAEAFDRRDLGGRRRLSLSRPPPSRRRRSQVPISDGTRQTKP